MSANLIFNVFSSSSGTLLIMLDWSPPNACKFHQQSRFYCVVWLISWFRIPEIGGSFFRIGSNGLHLVRAAHYSQLQLGFEAQ